MNRFYNKNIGPDVKNEKLAFAKAVLTAKKFKINKIIILISTKKNTSFIDRAISEDSYKQLFKGIKCDEIFVILHSLITVEDNLRDDCIILGYGLTSDNLFKFENNPAVKVIIAHQWSENEVEAWAKSVGAIEINSNLKATKTNLPDLVVQNAFRDLTDLINMSTGLGHPSDEELCKTYLRALKKYNYYLKEIEIRSFLISDLGWDSEHAEEVLKFVRKINQGKSFKGGAKTGLKKYIDKWKNR